MTKFTQILAVLVFSISMVASLQAQNTFWTEDFGGGAVPAGWMNADASGSNVLWTWCGDPTTGQDGSCPAIWDDGLNLQAPFASATADNGFVTVDSDLAGPLGTDHVAQLTTAPIDCSGQSEVWLKFESLIGVFTIPAETGAIARVSTNGTDWTDFTAFPGLVTGAPNPGAERWSFNPQYSIIDISSVAAGESMVYIQWQWQGNWEYMWNLDDVALYDADPTALFVPGNDMQVNSNFYAVAPNVQWPLSMVETFGFLADIQNVGTNDQTNVNLNVTIVNDATSAEVYNMDLSYGTIGSDSLAENELFPDAGYLPTETGTFSGTYTVSSDSLDENPDNNVLNFNFAITDSLFAKEAAPEFSTRPADDEWDPGTGWSWGYGNIYYVPAAQGLYARYVFFAIDGASSPAGQDLLVALYDWDDSNGDGQIDDGERNLLGFASYTITGSEDPATLISLPMTTLAGDPIALTDDTQYFVALEYQTDIEGETVEISLASSVDFGAMTFRSQELMAPRWGSGLAIGPNLSVEPYSTLGFGTDFVPVVRLSIGDPVMTDNTNDLLAPENVVNVYPNPTKDELNLDMDFTEAMSEVTVQIFDVNGTLIQTRELVDVKAQNETFNVASLANGTYMMHVTTPAGTRVARFTVLH